MENVEPSAAGSDDEFHQSSPPENNPSLPSSPASGSPTREAKPKNAQQQSETTPEASRPKFSINGRVWMDLHLRTCLMIFRILGFIFCLISFSVMAANENRGWYRDSFYRHKEFRYCLSIGVIGFVYSGLQIVDMMYAIAVRNQYRRRIDFTLDQILAYLLLSASSSAASKVEDWRGYDQFPTMARASIAISFLAFVAFAVTALLSGYDLHTNKYF